MNELLSAADQGLSVHDGRLRVRAGLRILLPDLDADPGMMRATHYNHTVTVRITEMDLMPMPVGFCMVAWGKPGSRKAIIVRSHMADELRSAMH